MRRVKTPQIIAIFGLAAVVAVASDLAVHPAKKVTNSVPAASINSATTITWEAGPITQTGTRKALIAAFEKENPTIKVKLINAASNTDTNRAQLATSIGSGATTPDIYLGDVIWPAQFGTSGLAQPLNKVFSKSFFNQFSSGLVAGATYKGQIYGVPIFTDTAFLFYRKDLLKKAGIKSPPTTWEQVKADSLLIEKKKLAKYGFIWQGDSYEGLTCDFVEYLADAGGSVFSANGTPMIQSAKTAKALNFMKSLITSGVTPKAVTTAQEDQSMNMFANGDVAFLRNWTYSWSVAQDPTQSKVVGKVGVVLLPKFAGQTKNYSAVGGGDLMVNPHTKYMSADKRFLEFVSSKQGQEIVAKYGSLPATKSVANELSHSNNSNPVFKLLPHVNFIARPSETPNYPEVSKAIYTNVNAVLAGSESVTAAINDMNKQLKSGGSTGGL